MKGCQMLSKLSYSEFHSVDLHFNTRSCFHGWWTEFTIYHHLCFNGHFTVHHKVWCLDHYCTWCIQLSYTRSQKDTMCCSTTLTVSWHPAEEVSTMIKFRIPTFLVTKKFQYFQEPPRMFFQDCVVCTSATSRYKDKQQLLTPYITESVTVRSIAERSTQVERELYG